MAAVATASWLEANQRYTAAAVAVVRTYIERRISNLQNTPFDEQRTTEVHAVLRAAAEDMPAPSSIDSLCSIFGLAPFERDVLILCAGMDLDGAIPSLCAAAQADPQKPYPTFALALGALPSPHWRALVPASPLRLWRLVEVGTGNSLALSPLRIDERILHYLAGIQHLDERLLGLLEPLPPAEELVPSHQSAMDRVVAVWSHTPPGSPLPAIQLAGPEPTIKRAIAAATCAAIGVRGHILHASGLPIAPAELESLVRLWERESSLNAVALYLDCESLDLHDPAKTHTVIRLLERVHGPVIVACRDRLPTTQRPSIALDVAKPVWREQRELWRQELGLSTEAFDSRIDELASQFSMTGAAIRAASLEVRPRVEGATGQELGATLWEACRVQARQKLDELAQRIESAAGWDDLVLPDPQRAVLQEMAVHVRQRAKVYETWGFASKGMRGLGLSALFAGASGTGKTMAAEVIARELQLDLYRIDLSSVVSKYIGETEKNLRRVFDAAENGGAILLFDEADALFGKRSEVKDSHDRYANIEVSYLLQRMEAYWGLAILTTNLKSALDTAFLRRIRFVVQFPFPDAEQRAEIWRRVFPAGAPRENLDASKLAQLNVAGGNIRNIALNAAFLAAEDDRPIRMSHVLLAARREYAKLEKPLTTAETAGWA